MSSIGSMRRRRRWPYETALLVLLGLWLTAAASAQERYPEETWLRYVVPEEAGWSSEGIEMAKAFADSIGTAAFLLVYDGAVVAAHGDYARRYMCHSVRKSLLSGLFGIYADEGRVDVERTLADLGVDDRYPLTPLEKRARIVDLLQARSGVYHPAAYETPAMAARRPDRGSHEPGTFWYYNNWDFNTLGAIFRRATGEDVFEAFDRRIAGPLGMQDFRVRDGYYHLEPEHSNFPAYPFRMSARDMARFGLLFEREGRWKDQQIIPADWVEESTRPYSEVERPGLDGYGYMWWVLGGELGRYGAYSALGVGAQTITVVPDLDLVFVHRVDTYVGDRVSLEDILDLLDRLIDARVGEEALSPRLVPLGEAAFGSGLARIPRDRLERYTGTYTYPSGRSVEVELEGDQLLIRDERAGTFGLAPLSDREFLVEDARVRVYFVPVAGDDSIAFIQERLLNGEGYYLLRLGRVEEAIDVFERNVKYYPASSNAHDSHGEALLLQGDTAAAAESYRRSLELNPGNVNAEWALVRLGAEGFGVVKLKPELLNAYAGKYRLGDATLTLSERDGRLFLTPPGTSPQPLVARSEAAFLYPRPLVVFKLAFVRDADGAVSGIRMMDGRGAEIWVERIE